MMAISKLFSFLKRNRKSPQQGPLRDIFSDSDACKRFGPFKTVFDIGAHHGKVSKKLKQLSPSAVVHAFEPFGKSYEVLKSRFSNDNRVVLNNLAVSSVVGEAPFYSNVGDETNSLLESVPTNDPIDAWTQNICAIKVKTITLDTYAINSEISQIDFIKIDTQGNTFDVLEGAGELLRRQAISWIYAEAEFIEIYKREKRFSEIEIYMRRYGYQLVNIYNMNFTQSGCLAWADVLFRAR